MSLPDMLPKIYAILKKDLKKRNGKNHKNDDLQFLG
jgi:hypothetical protein